MKHLSPQPPILNRTSASMARQLGLDVAEMNRGQVSQAIGHALALRELRKHKLLA